MVDIGRQATQFVYKLEIFGQGLVHVVVQT